MEPSSPSEVVDNGVGCARLDGRNGDRASPSHLNKSSSQRIMSLNRSLSDSSSAPNSPSAFAFSPIAGDNDNFYVSSYDTDLTSFIGSWEQHSNCSSGPSSSRRDKGKQKETDSEYASSKVGGKGKSIDLSNMPPSRLSFEFDFEFEQDNSNNDDTLAHTPASLPFNTVAPHFHIVNSPVSLSPSYSTMPSSDCVPYDNGIVHKRSASSLSLKSLCSSSSRSFNRIRRSFIRKNAFSNSNNRQPEPSFKSNSPSPSPHFHSFSSRSSSANSLKKGIRKVFGRKNSKQHGVSELPPDDDIQGDNESENQDPAPLNQSIISEATVSPQAQTGKLFGDAVVSNSTSVTVLEEPWLTIPLHNDIVCPETVREVKTWLATIPSSVPRDLFSELLPRELQLRVLKEFVSIYEDEYHGVDASMPTMLWTAKLAESTRWVGREKGMRELIRFGTVSKLWHSLVLDGQLWERIRLLPHVTPFCMDKAEALYMNSIQLSPSLLLKIATRAGPFARILDLRGWPHLDSVSFRAITTALSKRHEPFKDDTEQAHLLLPWSHTPPAFPYEPFVSSLSSPSSSYPCAETNLTHLTLRTCTGLTMHSIHYTLLRSPRLRVLDLHGLETDAVNDSTCELVNAFCPVLERLDIGRCLGIRGAGLEKLVREERALETEEDRGTTGKANTNTRSRLKMLFACGVRGVSPDVMFTLARFAPFLEVLDLSYSDITDEGLGAFVWCGDMEEEEEEEEEGDKVWQGVEVASRYMASASASPRFTFTPTCRGTYFKRLTSLLHLNLSFTRITDDACSFLSYSVPRLQCIELAGIGAALDEEGLVKLLETTPFIRKIDLEDANRIGDTVLKTLTPSSTTVQPGHFLEHLVLSYAQNISNNALLHLIRSCTFLTTLEVDNTRVSASIVRSFVEFMRTRGTKDAKIAVMDCRTALESCVSELLDAGTVRPRTGFRAFEARAIGGFLDGRDRERCDSLSPKASLASLRDPARAEIDECDETRVALKSFWSWQALDTAKEEEEKRNGTGKNGRDRIPTHGFGPSGSGPGSLSRPRWFSNWTRYLL